MGAPRDKGAQGSPRDKLRPKQRRFVEEYMIDRNATQAARRAGYRARSDATYAAIGAENLRKPLIAEELRRLEAEISEKTLVTAEEIVAGIKRIADDERNKPSDRLKGYELLGRYLNIFDRAKDNAEQEGVRVEIGEAVEWSV